MSASIRRVDADDVEQMVRNDFRAFGVAPDHLKKGIDKASRHLELDRYVVAEDRGEIVANAGAFTLDLTLPGGAARPVSGVTWVAVSSTHRRQGLLRSMMAELESDARSRSEAAMALFASEGGIYANVGFGAATQVRAVSIATAKAEFREERDPSSGSLHHLAPDEAARVLPELHDCVRADRAGEVSRPAAWWQLQMFEGRDPIPHTVAFTSPDGVVTGALSYQQTAHWHDGHPHHRVEVVDAIIGDPVAHHALWSLVCSIDLVGTVTTMHLPVDDSLPLLLADPRAVRTTDLNDGLWVRLLDVERWFSSRTYATEGAVVIEVDGGGEGVAGRWQIAGGPHGGSCAPSSSAADLTLNSVDLGAVSLGGTSPVQLLAAGRIVEHLPGAVRSFADLLRSDPAPFCSTEF
jgi:predicted acetyltransferase